MKWSYRELNPGPLACKASALPLSYNPETTRTGFEPAREDPN